MRDGKCPYPSVRGGREGEKQEIKIGSLKQLFMAGEGLSPNALMFNITHAAPPFTPALKPLLTLSTMFHTYTYLYLTIWIISQKDTMITISKTTPTTGARDHSRTARVWVEATKLFTICSSDAPISWVEEYFSIFWVSCASCENVGPTWPPKRSCFVDYKFLFNNTSTAVTVTWPR